MGRRRAAADDGGGGGLHRVHLELRELGLQHLGYTTQVAAGAHAGDDRVDAMGEVGQDFLRGGAHVDVHVGRVFKLLGNPRARGAGGQLFSAGDGAFHAFFTRGQVERCAVGQHQAAAFNGHAVGHHQHEFVALHRGHHGQAHAGVARGGLDDGAAGLQLARLLGVFHHGQRNTVLDRAAGVAALGLDPDLLAGLGHTLEQALETDVRGAADGLQNVVEFHGVDSS